MLRNALSRWLPSLEVWRPGWILTTGSLIITTVLWIAGRFPDGIPPDFWPWRGLSQLTVLWSVTLMAIAMLAVVRAHALVHAPWVPAPSLGEYEVVEAADLIWIVRHSWFTLGDS